MHRNCRHFALLLAAIAGCAPRLWREPATCPSCPKEPAKVTEWKMPNLLGIDQYATIPPGAVPYPNGAFVREWNYRMAAEAQADHFVIYLREWYLGGHHLGPQGQHHVELIAEHAANVTGPVIVEPCGDLALNAIHRQIVVQYLMEHGIADAEERVILAFPKAEGLYGFEAQRIYSSRILQSDGASGGGTNIGSGIGTSTSIGTSGLGRIGF